MESRESESTWSKVEQKKSKIDYSRVHIEEVAHQSGRPRSGWRASGSAPADPQRCGSPLLLQRL